MLSERAKHLGASRSYLVEAHFNCLKQAYDPMTNPSGYINLGTAENHLLWDLLEPTLGAVNPLPERVAHYDYLYGSLELRAAMVAYLQTYAHSSAPIDPEHIVVAAGATAIIDMLAYTLCDPGDAILIPAPYYSGFDADLKLRAEVKPIPVPLSAEQGFALTVQDLEQALAQAKQNGERVKAILINSPSNPLGHVYSQALLQEILAFCERRRLACIVDEIYLNSIHGDSPFSSVLSLTADHENLHYIYGFAKDFGLSGFKTGVYYSGNVAAVEAMRQLAYFSPVSTHTQTVLTRLLRDEALLKVLFRENKLRLRETYQYVSHALLGLGVPIACAEAGIFFLMDLHSLLQSPTFEAEEQLWRQLLTQCHLNFSPGQLFHCPEPGWFRFCFAKPKPTLEEVMRRLKRCFQ